MERKNIKFVPERVPPTPLYKATEAPPPPPPEAFQKSEKPSLEKLLQDPTAGPRPITIKEYLARRSSSKRLFELPKKKHRRSRGGRKVQQRRRRKAVKVLEAKLAEINSKIQRLDAEESHQGTHFLS